MATTDKIPVLTVDDIAGTTGQSVSTITAAGKAILDDADATAQRTTLGLGSLATQSGTFSGTSSNTNTGDQTISDATITTTDITTNNATTLKHGFVQKYPGGTTNFLRADGTFAAPTAVVADADMPETGLLTVATAKYHVTGVRHSAATTERITLAGTGRWRLQN